jgi:hypothetical protein
MAGLELESDLEQNFNDSVEDMNIAQKNIENFGGIFKWQINDNGILLLNLERVPQSSENLKEYFLEYTRPAGNLVKAYTELHQRPMHGICYIDKLILNTTFVKIFAAAHKQKEGEALLLNLGKMVVVAGEPRGILTNTVSIARSLSAVGIPLNMMTLVGTEKEAFSLITNLKSEEEN